MQTLLMAALVVVAASAPWEHAHAQERTDEARAVPPRHPAQPGAAGPPTSEAQRVRNHRHEYLGMLADFGAAIVDLSDVAQERATTERVRDYAAEAREEHRRIRQKVAGLAAASGIDLRQPWPDTPKEEQELAEMLSLASKVRAADGASFDRDYMLAMADIHEELAGDIEIDRNNAQGEGRALLDEILPTIRARASEARVMADGMGPGRTGPLPAK